MLQAGARIASGQWPYRDFWLNYPPGQPLVLARPAGDVRRLAAELAGAGDGADDAVVALLAYRLARRRAPESYALLALAGGGGGDGVSQPARAQPAGAGARVRGAAGEPAADRRWAGRWPGWPACSGSSSGWRRSSARC